MNKTVILLLCCLMPCMCMGQRAVISTNNIKELYAGYENEVSIALPNSPCSDIQLTATNCKVNGSGCDYVITPTPTEDIEETIFTIHNKKKNIVLDTIIVPVKRIDILVKITENPNNRGPIIKDGPIITSKNCPIINKLFQIVEFNIGIVRDTTILFDHKNIGNHYDKESLDALGKTKKGDKLYIEEIKVIGPDKTYRMMASISHTL